MEQLGCYYLHFFYPSHLLLDYDSVFSFEIENVDVVIKVNKHLKSLITNDFDNKIVSRQEGDKRIHEPEKTDITISDKSIVMVLENNEVGYILDYRKHHYKEFYHKHYTEVILSFEGTNNPSNINFAQRALSSFISSYKIISKDIFTTTLDKIPYVAKVYKEYFHAYSAEELVLKKNERMRIRREVSLNIKTVQLPFWNTQGMKFKTDEKQNSYKLLSTLKRKERRTF